VKYEYVHELAECVGTHLPVFGLALEQDGVFWLADLARVVILDLLDVGLGLDTVVFRERALVSLLLGDVRLERQYRTVR
jgi:hypothetical protein